MVKKREEKKEINENKAQRDIATCTMICIYLQHLPNSFMLMLSANGDD